MTIENEDQELRLGRVEVDPVATAAGNLIRDFVRSGHLMTAEEVARRAYDIAEEWVREGKLRKYIKPERKRT